MSQSLDESPAVAGPRFTQTQGQYLAFIYAYGRIFKRPPAEADMRRHFEVTAPTVHQMVLTLEKAGLITRVPGAARSIQLLVPPEALPILWRFSAAGMQVYPRAEEAGGRKAPRHEVAGG